MPSCGGFAGNLHDPWTVTMMLCRTKSVSRATRFQRGRRKPWLPAKRWMLSRQYRGPGSARQYC